MPKKKIAEDGRPYTKEEFMAYYGDIAGREKWRAACKLDDGASSTGAAQVAQSSSAGGEPIPPVMATQKPVLEFNLVRDLSRNQFMGVPGQSNPTPSATALQPLFTLLPLQPDTNQSWSLELLGTWIARELMLPPKTRLALRYCNGGVLQPMRNDSSVELLLASWPKLPKLEAMEVLDCAAKPARHESEASVTTSGPGVNAAAMLMAAAQQGTSASRGAAQGKVKTVLPTEEQRKHILELRAIKAQIVELERRQTVAKEAADQQAAADDADGAAEGERQPTADEQSLQRELVTKYLEKGRLENGLAQYQLGAELAPLLSDEEQSAPLFQEVKTVLLSEENAPRIVAAVLSLGQPMAEARETLMKKVIDPASNKVAARIRETQRQLSSVSEQLAATWEEAGEEAQGLPEQTALHADDAARKAGLEAKLAVLRKVSPAWVELVLWHVVPESRDILAAGEPLRATADVMGNAEKQAVHQEARGRLQLQRDYNSVVQTCTFSPDGKSITCTKGTACTKFNARKQQANTANVSSEPWSIRNWSKVGCGHACYAWAWEGADDAAAREMAAAAAQAGASAQGMVDMLKAAPAAAPSQGAAQLAQAAIALQQGQQAERSKLAGLSAESLAERLEGEVAVGSAVTLQAYLSRIEELAQLQSYTLRELSCPLHGELSNDGCPDACEWKQLYAMQKKVKDALNALRPVKKGKRKR